MLCFKTLRAHTVAVFTFTRIDKLVLVSQGRPLSKQLAQHLLSVLCCTCTRRHAAIKAKAKRSRYQAFSLGSARGNISLEGRTNASRVSSIQVEVFTPIEVVSRGNSPFDL